MTAAILWDIVEEHLDEAHFLIERWLSAAESARFSLLQLKRTIESRLIAHLDALDVGGTDVANQLLWPVLKEEREGSRTAAAMALLLGSDELAVQKLASAFRRTSHDDLRVELGIAFKVTARHGLGVHLRKALRATDPPRVQADLLDVLAVRREDPGPILSTMLESRDTELLAAALRAAVNVDGREPLRPVIEKRLFHDEPAVREAALRTGITWNLRAAWQACLAEAESGSAEALLLLALVGRPRDLPLLLDALQPTGSRAAALWALGFTGRVEAVDACMPLLDDGDPAVSRLAGEVVAAIAGLSIPAKAGADRGGQDEDGEDGELPALEDDLKRNLVPVSTDELVEPDAASVRAWWSSNRSRFAPEQRHIAGERLTATSLQKALREGTLRRAGTLACELAVKSAGRVQFPALHLDYPLPVVSTDVPLGKAPSWH